MTTAVLTISSKNYSSWCLRGFLLCKLAGLTFKEEKVSLEDTSARAELLLLAPSFLVPTLTRDGIRIWDTFAIAEYLAEAFPAAGLLPTEPADRSHCRAICGEMHAGFYNLRSALPMNLKAHHPGFKVWAGAQADVDRICTIWRDCLTASGGPFLFGGLTMADAMYAPVCTRFLTYDVKLDAQCASYCRAIMNLPAMTEWREAALAEFQELEELDVEF